MLERHQGAAAALAAPLEEWRAAGAGEAACQALATPDQALLDAGSRWLEQAGNRLLPWTSADYPPLLREIASPPPVLFIRGDAGQLLLPQLAIVGSRNATAAGREHAAAFARCFADAGFAICSGLAEGIDAAAHTAALAAGGRTTAVCGTGPDRVYPHRHRHLAGQIAANGVLVSEFTPGTPPRRSNFPRRNRIISGLSLGTLVVEAGLKSGALITARFANEQGREVFAIPGSIHNPLSRGCHQLIRQGAKLVESALDIIEELHGLLQGLHGRSDHAVDAAAARPHGPAAPELQKLLELLGWEPVGTDTLARRSGLTAAELSSMLVLLELEGYVRSLGGGRLQRMKWNSSS